MKTLLSALILIHAMVLSTIAVSQNIIAEKHYEDSNVKSVKIIGSFCDVQVVPGSRLVFDGIIKGDGDEGDYIIAMVKSGDDLLFKVERKRDRNWGWNDIDLARLDLELPSGVELVIDNSSGDIKVTGYEGSFLDVSSTSGDMALKEIKAEVGARSTSGDVVMRNVVGDVSMRSTSGDQNYFEIKGNLRTVATSGDIEVVRLTGDLNVETTSGDTELDDLVGAISARSTSGNIEGEYITISGDCRFKSTSGNIYMELRNDLEDIGFDLRATSGDLEAGRIDGEDRLVIRRGKYEISGVSTSGDQTYTN